MGRSERDETWDPERAGSNQAAANHARADYIREMGIWRAACRTCGHSVAHTNRRAAAAMFRNHSREIREAARDFVVDIREPGSPVAVTPPAG